MKSYYFKHIVAILLSTLVVVATFHALPSFAYAQAPLVVCGTTGTIGVNQNDATGCQACHLFELIDRVVRFLIFIGIAIASLLFAYAGFKYFTGGVSSHSEATAIFKDVFIGLIIALCGFLIVDTTLRSLASGQFVGPGWNKIQCSNRSMDSISNGGLGFSQIPGTGVLVVTSSAPPFAVGPSGPGVLPSSVSPADMQAATAGFYGQSTLAGPGSGDLACVWAVNQVLEAKGIKSIAADTQNVGAMEDQIRNGRGYSVVQAAAGPGDIVIQSDRGHVGLCVNAGCTQVVSNGSSAKAFTWVSSTSFDGKGQSRIYRVAK